MLTNSENDQLIPGSESRQKGEPSALQSEILSKLRVLLEGGQFTEGSRLPPERALAAQFGVGRPALREALTALSVLDVLESRRGSGTYVKSLAGLESGWPSQLNRTGIDPNMMELLEVRKMIEPKAAALAAARATESQLRTIGHARHHVEQGNGNASAVAQGDFEFHTAILAASGNRVLMEVNRALTPLLVQSRNITVRTFRDVDKMHAQHYAIFEAIVCGQSSAAEQAMLDHLHTVGLDLISERRR
jgi:GntR family transcriptional regulator, transcriptional repressor for pyruvate dehydrogenase complex